MDDRVFYANYEEKKPLFTVDLLLDASASRLQYQEMIAAQGVILSESLQACHIPVRVSEFCSVRGYTVLRILKAFEEKKSDVKVSQEEYDEVVAIKTMFLNAMYQ